MDIGKIYTEAFGDITLDTKNEIIHNLDIIGGALSMTGEEAETLRACFKAGPLFDGDVPSKNGRDGCLDKGFIEKTITKGEWGFNACTYRGAWALAVRDAAVSQRKSK